MNITKVIGIAINEYDDLKLNTLENCFNDISTITSLLKSKYKTDDIEILTGKEKTTRKYLYNFLNSYFVNALSNENILLFYAGHGEYNALNKITFWQTSDSLPDDSSTWFSLNDLFSFIKNSKAIHISLVLDSCFSGGLFENNYRGGGIKTFDNKKSREALTSGGLERVKDGTIGNLSPFTNVVCKVLEENSDKELSFIQFAHNVILQFNLEKDQTPKFCSIENTGHEGGSLVLVLNDKELEFKNFSDYSINLDFNYPIKINYTCKLPKFRKNSISDFRIINSKIESIAFEYISEIRKHIAESLDFRIQEDKWSSLEINYEILTYDEKHISLIIKVEDFFYSAYPNDRVYSINIKFNPDIKMVLSDLVESDDLQKLLKDLIPKYSECKEQEYLLLDKLEEMYYDQIEFAFDSKNINLYFVNEVIRAYHAYGNISIPISEFKVKK